MKCRGSCPRWGEGPPGWGRRLVWLKRQNLSQVRLILRITAIATMRRVGVEWNGGNPVYILSTHAFIPNCALPGCLEPLVSAVYIALPGLILSLHVQAALSTPSTSSYLALHCFLYFSKAWDHEHVAVGELYWQGGVLAGHGAHHKSTSRTLGHSPSLVLVRKDADDTGCWFGHGKVKCALRLGLCKGNNQPLTMGLYKGITRTTCAEVVVRDWTIAEQLRHPVGIVSLQWSPGSLQRGALSFPPWKRKHYAC